MLFRQKVDSEINLIMLQESLSENLFQLVDSDREYLDKWLPWIKHTKTVEDTRIFIKNSIVGFSEGRSFNLAIEYLNEIVGVAGYNTIYKDLKKVEMGYWITSKQQGKGIITRSCNKLIQYAFNDLDFDKVQISVAIENIKSRNVCERLGLKLEGIIKNSEKLHDKIVDHAIYGLCKNKA